MDQLKIGDIYRWEWKIIPQGMDPYWCLSRIAIVDTSGKLRDTYWYSSNNKVLNPSEVDLTFLANMDALKEGRLDAYEHYLESDIVDIRHPNGGGIYIKIDAVEDKNIIRQNYTKKRDAAQNIVDLYERLLESL